MGRHDVLVRKPVRHLASAGAAADRFRIRGEARASEGQLDLDEELLDPRTAAEWLGLAGPAALWRLIEEEGLPHIRIEEPLLIPKSDLELWSESRPERHIADETHRTRKVTVLRRFFVTAAFGREELVAWCNASIDPPERVGRERGRPRIRAVSPNATKAVVVGVMAEAIERDVSPLLALCRTMESRGVRRMLEEAGNGRALELLVELEEGLGVEREGPEVLSPEKSLELPGVWGEIEDWVEDLLAELVSGEASESPRLRAELIGVIRLLREGATISPMVLLYRMTLFQLRSFAAHLALPARRSKDELVGTVAKELRARFEVKEIKRPCGLGTPISRTSKRAG